MLSHVIGPQRLSYVLLVNYVPKCQMSLGSDEPILPKVFIDKKYYILSVG